MGQEAPKPEPVVRHSEQIQYPDPKAEPTVQCNYCNFRGTKSKVASHKERCYWHDKNYAGSSEEPSFWKRSSGFDFPENRPPPCVKNYNRNVHSPNRGRGSKFGQRCRL